MDVYVNVNKLYCKVANYVTIVADMVASGATMDDLKSSLDKFIDLDDVRSDNYCHAMLKTGEKAGSFCNQETLSGSAYCSKHLPQGAGDLIKYSKDVVKQKLLLVDGSVMDIVPDEKPVDKKKVLSVISGNNLGPSRYGDLFTRTRKQHHGIWGFGRDRRCKGEKEEANGIGFIVDCILWDKEEGISDKEAMEVISNHKWKYINLDGLGFGTTYAVNDIESYEKDPVSGDIPKEIQDKIQRLYHVKAFMEEVITQQREKEEAKAKIKKKLVKGKLWEKHMEKTTGQRILKKGSMVNMVRCQRGIMELMIKRKEPIERIIPIVGKGVILERYAWAMLPFLEAIFEDILPNEDELKGKYKNLDELVDDADNLLEDQNLHKKIREGVRKLRMIKEQGCPSLMKLGEHVDEGVASFNSETMDDIMCLDSNRLTEFGKSCKERALELYNEHKTEMEEFKNRNKKIQEAACEKLPDGGVNPYGFQVKEDKPLTLKELRDRDPKRWGRIMFEDKCKEYAMKEDLGYSEFVINELIKRESNRGVTPFIIFPPLSYEATGHRNWFCQDIKKSLYGPYYMIPILETNPGFKDYGERAPDHIYIRYETMVREKKYKNPEWQIFYHRLQLFYTKYFGFRSLHPDFIEAREPITMMRAARILGGNYEEMIFSMNLDIEYLDEMKLDLYKMLYMKGKTKTQDLIVMIYEEFAATYVQQMIREMQLIMREHGDKDIPQNIYWLDLENPPKWINKEELSSKKAGVRSHVDEEGIFSGKYDSSFKTVDPDDFNILDPITIYRKEREKKGSTVDTFRYIFLKKKKQLFDETKEEKIPIPRLKENIHEVKSAVAYSCHMMNERDKEERAKKFEKKMEIIENFEENVKMIKENIIREKEEKKKEFEELPSKIWKNAYKLPAPGEASIPIVEHENLEEAKVDPNRMISVIREKGKKDMYLIWQSKLEKYIEKYVAPNRKKNVEKIKKARLNFMVDETFTMKERYYKVFGAMIGKEPSTNMKYFKGDIRSLIRGDSMLASQIVGRCIDDVGTLLELFRTREWEPEISIEIFDMYRGLVDSLFQMHSVKINNKEMDRYSPKMKGDISVLNLRYEIEEELEKYDAYKYDLAWKLSDDIVHDYGMKYNEGLLKMIPME